MKYPLLILLFSLLSVVTVQATPKTLAFEPDYIGWNVAITEEEKETIREYAARLNRSRDAGH